MFNAGGERADAAACKIRQVVEKRAKAKMKHFSSFFKFSQMPIELLLYKVKTFFKKIFTRQLCWFKVSAQNQTRTTLQDASDSLKTTATSFIFHIQYCPRHLFTVKLLKLIPLEQWLFWNHSPVFWTEAPNCSWHAHKARSHSPHTAQR